MHLLPRFSATALATTLLLGLMVTQTSAGTLRVSNQQLRVTWRRLELAGSDGTVFSRCPVTLESSFHAATIAKVRKSLIGYATTARFGTCESGRVTVLTETLPWHLTYESFSGPLPNITRIRILLVGMSFLTEQLGFRCLLKATAEAAASAELILGAGGRVEGFVFDSAKQIPTRGGLGGFGCPSATVGFRTEANDRGGVTLLGTSNSISITLI
jgi:hypothetical protein